MTRSRLRTLSTVLLAALVLGQGWAVAEQGVSINLGSIRVDEPLERGGSYRLPVMEVTNEGTEVSTYRMTARPVTGQEELPLVAEWFSMSPSEFTLQPGELGSVAIMLNVPRDAKVGAYAGLVGPSLVPAIQGASIGAGVASKVTFEVALDDASLTSIVDDYGVWVYGAVGLLMLVWVVAALRRRFTFRIERR